MKRGRSARRKSNPTSNRIAVAKSLTSDDVLAMTRDQLIQYSDECRQFPSKFRTFERLLGDGFYGIVFETEGGRAVKMQPCEPKDVEAISEVMTAFTIAARTTSTLFPKVFEVSFGKCATAIDDFG